MNIIDKVKLLYKAREPVTEIIKEVSGAKDSWKTVRFWLSLIGSFMALASAIQGVIPVTVAVCISVGLTLIYNIFQALKDADKVGYSPIIKSTKFWSAVLTAISVFLTSLQTGGINPQWVTVAIGVIGFIVPISREIASNDPNN